MSMTNKPPPRDRTRARLPLHWLGVVPFLLFVLLFLVLPTMNIVIGAFRNPAGEFTLQNIYNLFTPSIMAAYWISIRISLPQRSSAA
jgi:putative spermidine/putrescine transport system permease protein